MRHKMLFFLTLLISFSFTFYAYPQDSSRTMNPAFLKAMLNLEQYIHAADDNIQRYEKSIDRCDKNIKTSTEIINSSRQAGNTEAATIASDALTTANQNRQKNVRLIQIANDRKAQCRKILAELEEKARSVSPKTTAALLHYSGTVTIKKADGSTAKLNEINGSTLEDGDVISTAEKSKVELQFLDGRGHMVVGEKSQMKFSKNDSSQVVDMLEGKIKMDVKKVEKFLDDLPALYEEYTKYATHPVDSFDAWFKKLHDRCQKKLSVRTPTVVIAIRGTEFITYCKDTKGELIVLEGCVEMKSNFDGKTVLVNGGQNGTITDSGKVLEVHDIDLNKEERWWKDEE